MRPAAPNLSLQRCIDAASFDRDWNDWGGFFLHGANCVWQSFWMNLQKRSRQVFLLAFLWVFPVLLHGEESVKEYRNIEEMRKKAEQGDAGAQYALGFCYNSGLGVEKNEAEPVIWYRKAAEQGVADAQAQLGFCYDTASGVNKNNAEAVVWYRKAAEQGNAGGQYSLGDCYAKGRGVDKNEVEAVRWYRKAAEQGYVQAQFSLGYCYASGRGVEKNEAEAVKWYRKGADHDHAPSQCNMAYMYAQGCGVVKNDIEAYKWFLLSAAKGFKAAKENMEVSEKILTPEQRAEGQRLATEWQAAFEKRKQESE